MTNTLNFYNPSQWNRLKYSISLGDGLSDISGVCFDDYFFWTAHTTGVVNQWYIHEGALYKSSTFDVSGILPNFVELQAILTDGLDLWLGWSDSISSGDDPPTFSTNYHITKFSKNGDYYATTDMSASVNPGGGLYDIAYDTHNIIVIDGFDRIARWNIQDKKVSKITAAMIRTFVGVTWSGAQYYGVRNTGHGHVFDYDGTIITNQVATGLGLNAHGMDFGSTKLDIQDFERFTNGEWVVIGAR